MFCVCALAAGTLRGQAPAVADAPVPTLRVFANLIQVPVLVLTPGHEPVATIAPSRFTISLDGGPLFHPTLVREQGEDPIALSVLLDLRQSGEAMYPQFGDALSALAPAWLRPHDLVSVYAVRCSLYRASSLQPADPASLRHAVALGTVTAEARTAAGKPLHCANPMGLWDTLLLTIRQMNDAPGRRVLLVVTNGDDRSGGRSSQHTWSEVARLAQRTGVAIVGLKDPGFDSSIRAVPEDELNALCELSGGVLLSARLRQLPQDLVHFTTMLRGRYIVEFPRPKLSPGQTVIDVRVSRANLFIRAAGVGVSLADPALKDDPMTLPEDESKLPAIGKRRILQPE